MRFYWLITFMTLHLLAIIRTPLINHYANNSMSTIVNYGLSIGVLTIPNTDSTSLNKAKKYYCRGKYKKALKIVKQSPNHEKSIPLLFLMADIYYNQDSTEKLTLVYDQILHIDSNSIQAHQGIFDLLYNQKEYVNALKQSEKLISLDSSSATAWINNFKALYRVGDFDNILNAKNQFEKVEKTLEDSLDYYIYLGDYYFCQALYTDAYLAYEVVTKNKKANWYLYQKGYFGRLAMLDFITGNYLDVEDNNEAHRSFSHIFETENVDMNKDLSTVLGFIFFIHNSEYCVDDKCFKAYQKRSKKLIESKQYESLNEWIYLPFLMIYYMDSNTELSKKHLNLYLDYLNDGGLASYVGFYYALKLAVMLHDNALYEKINTMAVERNIIIGKTSLVD